MKSKHPESDAVAARIRAYGAVEAQAFVKDVFALGDGSSSDVWDDMMKTRLLNFSDELDTLGSVSDPNWPHARAALLNWFEEGFHNALGIWAAAFELADAEPAGRA